MSFKAPPDLSGGLYFFDGERTTVGGERTFDVLEPRIGKYYNGTVNQKATKCSSCRWPATGFGELE